MGFFSMKCKDVIMQHTSVQYSLVAVIFVVTSHKHMLNIKTVLAITRNIAHLNTRVHPHTLTHTHTHTHTQFLYVYSFYNIFIICILLFKIFPVIGMQPYKIIYHDYRDKIDHS